MVTKVTEDGRTRKAPKEPAHQIYNDLVTRLGYRPFRTTAGEARVAVPTPFGLEVLDATDPGLGEYVGYVHYTLRGEPVPAKGLTTVATALQQRGLARDLPRERIVELGIRVVRHPGAGSLLDLADSMRRCVVITPDGWSFETVGYPTFDRPCHMLPLPEPTRPGLGTRPVDTLWKFVLVEPAQRVLALAVIVEYLLFPKPSKPATIICGGEGLGKTSSARHLQAVVDPSLTRTIEPPKCHDDGQLLNLSMNHSVLNFDNMSNLDSELSDSICRLVTGAGLTKRLLHSNRDELLSEALPWWVVLNGITPTPRAADLLRRSVFLDAVRPEDLGLERAGDAEVDEVQDGESLGKYRTAGGSDEVAHSPAWSVFRELRESPSVVSSAAASADTAVQA